MMQLTAAMIGMLGGPALQVLMVLAIEKEPRSLGFLVDMTNLSEKTVSQAVRKLNTLGMITESRRYVYQIAGQAVQLPLAAEELPAETAQAVEEEEPEESPELGRKIYDLALNESMNESDPLINRESLIDSLIDSDAEEVVNSDLATRADLASLGFYGRGLEELLKLGVLLDDAFYHVQHAPSLGAALARLKRRQPVPADWLGKPPPVSTEEPPRTEGLFAEIEF
jgi:DNA-binding Lrp family transcriptional regulator